MLLLIDFRMSGPKRRFNRRLGPGIITTPPTPAAAAVATTAGTAGQQQVAEKWGSRHDLSRAPGTFFSSFFFFNYTNFYLCLDLRLHYEGYNDDNGPKRRETRRLGPR